MLKHVPTGGEFDVVVVVVVVAAAAAVGVVQGIDLVNCLLDVTTSAVEEEE